MKEKNLIVLLGRTASGKTTIAKYLCENYKYDFVVPYTTRPKRSNEVFGKDYYFASKNTFEQLEELDAFYAKSQFRGWKYGISRNDIGQLNYPLAVADNLMLKDLLNRQDGINKIYIYIYRPDDDRYKTLVERGTPECEIVRRWDDETIVWTNILSDINIPLNVVDNIGSLEDTVTKVLEVIAENTGG